MCGTWNGVTLIVALAAFILGFLTVWRLIR